MKNKQQISSTPRQVQVLDFFSLRMSSNLRRVNNVLSDYLINFPVAYNFMHDLLKTLNTVEEDQEAHKTSLISAIIINIAEKYLTSQNYLREKYSDGKMLDNHKRKKNNFPVFSRTTSYLSETPTCSCTHSPDASIVSCSAPFKH